MLAASCFAGVAAGLLAGRRLPVSTALLVGWCVAATAHLALSVRAMARTTPEAVRRRAALLEDEKWAVLGGALAAAVAGASKTWGRPLACPGLIDLADA